MHSDGVYGCILRFEAVHVAREHGSIAHIGELQKLHGQALQADAQAAVGRHSNASKPTHTWRKAGCFRLARCAAQGFMEIAAGRSFP